jgi:hypothetical protein
MLSSASETKIEEDEAESATSLHPPLLTTSPKMCFSFVFWSYVCHFNPDIVLLVVGACCVSSFHLLRQLGAREGEDSRAFGCCSGITEGEDATALPSFFPTSWTNEWMAAFGISTELLLRSCSLDLPYDSLDAVSAASILSS